MRAPKKAIVLVLLALVLGASVFYFVLGGEGPRRIPTRRVPVDTSTVRNPRQADEPAGREEAGALADPRATVEAAPVPEARATYEGTVIGDGEPLPGASIEISVRGEPLADAQTNERGRFRIVCPPPDEAALLTIRARGFVPLERTLLARMRGGTELLGNLRVIRGVRLAGRVVDGRGNGIADAEITIEPGSNGTDVLRARGRSSPDGTFEVADVPPGPVVVRARARGFGERTVEHSGQVDKPLEIQLDPGHEMRFRVITPRGEPIANAEVTILPLQAPRTNQRTARTDATGRAAFESLGTSQWNVRITHPDFKTTGRSNIEATGIEETFECQPWPGITGQVYVPSGSALPKGTRVQAMPATAPGDRMVVEGGGQPVDDDGHFHIGGLRPGDWVIRVSAPGYAPTQSAPVRLGLEGDAWAGTIELESAANLVLRITRETRPVAGALVELVSVAPTPAQLWAFQESRELSGPDGESDVEGRVTLSDLPTGPVWALVFADGSPPFVAGPLEVVAGQTRGETVSLPKGARVTGMVKTAEGRPCPNVQLRLTERDGVLGFPMTLVTDGNGQYTSSWLPAGHYTIEAFTNTEPTRRSGPQEFALAPGEQNEMDISL
jgi:protocatechuate 3,4-dioxygenase beta subunit